MKLAMVLLLTGVCLSAACKLGVRASASDLDPNRQTQSSHQEGARRVNPQDRNKYYQEVAKVRWVVEDNPIEASVEEVNVTFFNRPAWLPDSILTIRNLSSGKQLYYQEANQLFLGMYVRDINGDTHDELILYRTGGAVSNAISIIEVVAGQEVKVLLEDIYRVDAWLMSLKDDSVDVFVTDGEFGSGPFRTRHYEWKNGRYLVSGEASYATLKRNLQKSFKASAK